MKETEFEKLLLKTVFAFMVCDSHISYDEVQLIKKNSNERKLFGNIDIDVELKDLIEHVNRRGIQFFDDYFKKIKHAKLDEHQELKLIDVSIKMIHADYEIKQEEINFLKILRVLLKVSNPKIMETFPTIGEKFVDPDQFTEMYFKELYSNFFKITEMPTFDISDVIDISDKVDN